MSGRGVGVSEWGRGRVSVSGWGVGSVGEVGGSVSALEYEERSMLCCEQNTDVLTN